MDSFYLVKVVTKVIWNHLSMKKFISVLVVSFSCFSAYAQSELATVSRVEPTAKVSPAVKRTPSPRVEKTDPYYMIKKVAEITFERFLTEHDEIRANPNLLKTIVRDELMPYVDYKYAALKIIGAKNIRQTTSEERNQFIPVFREYLVTSYAQVFTLYNKQEVLFAPAKPFDKQKIVAVHTSVNEPGRAPINISFRVRKNKKTGEWKAYDMVAEGVSLLDSKQSELSSIIRQKGLPHVTEMLQVKTTRNISFN